MAIEEPAASPGHSFTQEANSQLLAEYSALHDEMVVTGLAYDMREGKVGGEDRCVK
jgi:hypothetical protein